MTALDAVHEQEHFLLVAQRAQAEQVFWRRGRDTAFTLHAFDQYGNRGGRNRIPRGFEVVEWNMPEARRHWLKTLFDFVLSSRGNAGECAAVKGICRGQDFKPAFVVAEFPRELE